MKATIQSVIPAHVMKPIEQKPYQTFDDGYERSGQQFKLTQNMSKRETYLMEQLQDLRKQIKLLKDEIKQKNEINTGLQELLALQQKEFKELQQQYFALSQQLAQSKQLNEDLVNSQVQAMKQSQVEQSQLLGDNEQLLQKIDQLQQEKDKQISLHQQQEEIIKQLQQSLEDLKNEQLELNEIIQFKDSQKAELEQVIKNQDANFTVQLQLQDKHNELFKLQQLSIESINSMIQQIKLDLNVLKTNKVKSAFEQQVQNIVQCLELLIRLQQKEQSKLLICQTAKQQDAKNSQNQIQQLNDQIQAEQLIISQLKGQISQSLGKQQYLDDRLKASQEQLVSASKLQQETELQNDQYQKQIQQLQFQFNFNSNKLDQVQQQLCKTEEDFQQALQTITSQNKQSSSQQQQLKTYEIVVQEKNSDLQKMQQQIDEVISVNQDQMNQLTNNQLLINQQLEIVQALNAKLQVRDNLVQYYKLQVELLTFSNSQYIEAIDVMNQEQLEKEQLLDLYITLLEAHEETDICQQEQCQILSQFSEYHENFGNILIKEGYDYFSICQAIQIREICDNYLLLQQEYIEYQSYELQIKETDFYQLQFKFNEFINESNEVAESARQKLQQLNSQIVKYQSLINFSQNVVESQYNDCLTVLNGICSTQEEVLLSLSQDENQQQKLETFLNQSIQHYSQVCKNFVSQTRAFFPVFQISHSDIIEKINYVIQKIVDLFNKVQLCKDSFSEQKQLLKQYFQSQLADKNQVIDQMKNDINQKVQQQVDAGKINQKNLMSIHQLEQQLQELTQNEQSQQFKVKSLQNEIVQLQQVYEDRNVQKEQLLQQLQEDANQKILNENQKYQLLQEFNSKIQKQLEIISEQFSSQKVINLQLKDNNSSKQQQVAQLVEQLKQADLQSQQYLIEIESQKDQLSKSKENSSLYEQQFIQCQTRSKDLQYQLISKDDEISLLKNDVKKSNERFSLLQQEIYQLKSSILEKETKIQLLLTEANLVTDKLQEVQQCLLVTKQELAENNQQLNQFDNEIIILKTLIEKLNTQLCNEKLEHKRVQDSQLLKLDEETKTKIIIQQQLSQVQQQQQQSIQDLQDMKKMLEQNIQDYQENCNLLESVKLEKQQFLQQLKIKQSELESLQLLIDEQRANCVGFNNNLDQKLEKINQLTKEKQNLQENLQESTQHVGQLVSQIDKQKQVQAGLQQQLIIQQQTNSALSESIKMLKEQHNDLESQVDQLKCLVDNNKQVILQLKQENQNFQNKLMELEIDNGNLNNNFLLQQSQASIYKQKAEQQIQELQKINKDLQQSNLEIEQNQRVLQQQFIKLQKEKEQLSQQLEDCEQENLKKVVLLESINSQQLEELGNYKIDKDHLKEQLQMINVKVNSLNEVISSNQKQYNAKLSEKEQLVMDQQSRYAEQRQQKIDLQKEVQQQQLENRKQEDICNQLNQELQQLKYQFDDQLRQISIIKEDNDSLLTKNSDLNQNNLSLQQENQELKQDIQFRQNQLELVQQSSDTLQQQVDELTGVSLVQVSQLQSTQQELSNKDQKLIKMNESLSNIQNEKKAIQQQLNKAEEQLLACRNSLQNLQNQQLHQERANIGLNLTLSQLLQNEIKQLQVALLESMEQLATVKELFKEKISSLNDQIKLSNELKIVISDLQEENKIDKYNIAQYFNKMQVSSQQVNKLSQNLNDMQILFESSQVDIKNLRDELDKRNKIKDSLCSQLESFKLQLVDQEQKVFDCLQKVTVLTKENEKMLIYNENLQQITIEKENEVNTNQQYIQELSTLNKKIQGELKEQVISCNQLQIDKTELQQQLDSCQANLQTLQQNHQEGQLKLMSNILSNQDLLQVNELQKEQIRQYEIDLNKLKQTNLLFKQEQIKCKQQFDSLLSEVQNKDANNLNISQDLRKQKDKVEQLQNEIKKKQSSIDEQLSKIDEQEDQIQKLENQITKLSTKLQLLDNTNLKNEQLIQQLNLEAEKFAKQNDELQQQIRLKDQKLNQCSLIIQQKEQFLQQNTEENNQQELLIQQFQSSSAQLKYDLQKQAEQSEDQRKINLELAAKLNRLMESDNQKGESLIQFEQEKTRLNLKIEDLNKQLSESTTENTNQNQQLALIKENKEQLSELVKKQLEELKEKQFLIEQLSSKAESVAKQNQSQYTAINSQQNCISGQIVEIKQRINGIKQQLIDDQKTISEQQLLLNNSTQQLTVETNKKQILIQQQDKALLDFSNEISGLKDNQQKQENIYLSQCEAQKETMQKNQALLNSNSNLHQTINNQNIQLTQAANQIEELTKQYTEKEQQLKQLQDKIKANSIYNQKQTGQLDLSRKEADELKSYVQLQQQGNQKLNDVVKSFQLDLSPAAVEKLEYTLGKLLAIEQQFLQLQQQTKQKKIMIKRLQKQIATKASLESEAKQQIDQLTQERDALNESLKDTQFKCEGYEAIGGSQAQQLIIRYEKEKILTQKTIGDLTRQNLRFIQIMQSVGEMFKDFFLDNHLDFSLQFSRLAKRIKNSEDKMIQYGRAMEVSNQRIKLRSISQTTFQNKRYVVVEKLKRAEQKLASKEYTGLDRLLSDARQLLDK